MLQSCAVLRIELCHRWRVWDPGERCSYGDANIEQCLVIHITSLSTASTVIWFIYIEIYLHDIKFEQGVLINASIAIILLSDIAFWFEVLKSWNTCVTVRLDTRVDNKQIDFLSTKSGKNRIPSSLKLKLTIWTDLNSRWLVPFPFVNYVHYLNEWLNY